MNILFISDRQALPTFGGIERVINNLARQFALDGHKCFHAYFSMIDEGKVPSPLFDDELVLTGDLKSNLERFIKEKHIDFVINNCIAKNRIKVIMPVLSAIKPNTPHTRYCFLYHNSCVGAEKLHCDYGFYWKRLLSKSWRKAEVLSLFGKAVLFDAFPHIVKVYFQKKYRRISDNEPNLVLLSEQYKQNFANITGQKSISPQWHAIANSLCFDIREDIDFTAKEKIVLLVARLDEDQKRIAAALKIWRRLQENAPIDHSMGWKFVIVGDGKDRQIYEKMVRKCNIPNVSFEGWQDSLPYYMKASIFVMTSIVEGFPMTLLEAKQCGCVPISYDSFEAVYDVIENGKDGYIVKYNDAESFIERLISLMVNDDLRIGMAKNGIVSAQKFSVDKIAHEWYDYYNKLV